jgi:hypothetical protein
MLVVVMRLGSTLARLNRQSTDFEHIPPDLIAHLMAGAAACEAVGPFTEFTRSEGWPLDAERITCAVRMVWGTADKLLAWPSAAARFRDD